MARVSAFSGTRAYLVATSPFRVEAPAAPSRLSAHRRLCFRHERAFVHPASQHENCMEGPNQDRERFHEPHQSGYQDAPLPDFGRGDWKYYGDREKAGQDSTSDNPSAAASRGAHRKSHFYSRRPAAFSHGRRRNSPHLRQINSAVSRRVAVSTRLPGHRGTCHSRHPGSVRSLHVAFDPQAFSESLSPGSNRIELLTIHTSGRMREARRGRHSAGDAHE